MTESIFVPFRLTTREACERAAEVLLGEPSPMVKSGVKTEYIEGTEAVREFTERLRRKRKKIEASK